jgi:hypothetical protein
MGVAWVVTMGISLTAALVREWRLDWGLLALVAWVFGSALCAWAAVEGWRATRRAYARWPAGRLGTGLSLGILVISSALLARARPGVWGTDLRLNGLGAVALALAVTLWVGLPLVWTVLRVLRGAAGPHKIPGARGAVGGA